MQPRHRSGARVLVIDDERGIRDALSHVLIGMGHAVVTVGEGRLALKLASSGGFDLAFCDLMLPGMSGFALLSALKRERPELPVVLMTGYPTDEAESGAMMLGAWAFLPKPFDLGLVESLVSRAFDARREPHPSISRAR